MPMLTPDPASRVGAVPRAKPIAGTTVAPSPEAIRVPTRGVAAGDSVSSGAAGCASTVKLRRAVSMIRPRLMAYALTVYRPAGCFAAGHAEPSSSSDTSVPNARLLNSTPPGPMSWITVMSARPVLRAVSGRSPVTVASASTPRIDTSAPAGPARPRTANTASRPHAARPLVFIVCINMTFSWDRLPTHGSRGHTAHALTNPPIHPPTGQASIRVKHARPGKP